MPQRTSTGQTVPRLHRGSGRAGRRVYRTQTRRFRRQYRRAAPQRQAQQRSYRRYYRQQGVPRQTRNVGRYINRQVQHERRVATMRRGRQARHQRRLKGHRRRVELKKTREARQEIRRNKTLRGLIGPRADLIDSLIRRGVPYRNAEKWGRYNEMAERLWGEAAPLLGAKGEDMPEIRHANTLWTGPLAGKNRAYAYVQDDGGDIARVLGKPKLAKRRVHVSKNAYLAGGRKRQREVPLRYFKPKHRKAQARYRKRTRHDPQTVLLHEWAHTKQQFAGKPKWETEGGADEFAHWAAKKLGYDPSPSHSREYRQYRRKVKKRHSRQWVKHGQFK